MVELAVCCVYGCSISCSAAPLPQQGSERTEDESCKLWLLNSVWWSLHLFIYAPQTFSQPVTNLNMHAFFCIFFWIDSTLLHLKLCILHGNRRGNTTGCWGPNRMGERGSERESVKAVGVMRVGVASKDNDRMIGLKRGAKWERGETCVWMTVEVRWFSEWALQPGLMGNISCSNCHTHAHTQHSQWYIHRHTVQWGP